MTFFAFPSAKNLFPRKSVTCHTVTSLGGLVRRSPWSYPRTNTKLPDELEYTRLDTCGSPTPNESTSVRRTLHSPSRDVTAPGMISFYMFSDLVQDLQAVRAKYHKRVCPSSPSPLNTTLVFASPSCPELLSVPPCPPQLLQRLSDSPLRPTIYSRLSATNPLHAHTVPGFAARRPYTL